MMKEGLLDDGKETHFFFGLRGMEDVRYPAYFFSFSFFSSFSFSFDTQEAMKGILDGEMGDENINLFIIFTISWCRLLLVMCMCVDSRVILNL